jgi:glutamyl-tRNA synthetase
LTIMAPPAIKSVNFTQLPAVKGPTVFYCAGNLTLLPELSQLVAPLVGSGPIAFTPSPDAAHGDHLPYFTDASGISVSGDGAIARFLARSSSGPSVLGNGDALEASVVDQWLDYYTVCTASKDFRDFSVLPALLDAYFADKTFAAGHSLSLADVAIYVLLRRSKFAASAAFPNVSRWYLLVSPTMPKATPLFRDMTKANAKSSSSTAAASSSKSGAEKVKASATAGAGASAGAEGDEGGSCPPLEGVIEGAVCTRFPPEPSGYLHLGKLEHLTTIGTPHLVISYCIVVFGWPVDM